MFQEYHTVIKPMNDKLGRDLGIKKIQVLAIQSEEEVPVKVTFWSQQGNKVTYTNRQINSYKALGLRI